MNRYDILNSNWDSGWRADEQENGEFVKYSDIEPRLALMREMAELLRAMQSPGPPTSNTIWLDSKILLAKYEEMEKGGERWLNF